jgi:hypothetical protein
MKNAYEIQSFSTLFSLFEYYVYGSVHRESMSIIVQQGSTIFIIFLESALHVSGNNSTHHQEHI